MDIRKILKQYWGYDVFRPLQEEIILSVMAGKDTLALMPTGGGKSITYQVPALALPGICLVITPLIALMKDQVEELQKRDIPAVAIYTGMEYAAVESAINRAIAGRVKLLYISPERLASANFRSRLKQMEISMFAVDEAHCISQWGYDFRPSYLRIAEVRVWFTKAPVLALTATATARVCEDIQEQLQFSVPHILSKSFRRENIAYVVRKANDKLGELLHILSKLQASSIVYVRKRASAEELAKFLCQKGILADFYHAGLSSVQRARKQEKWKTDVVPVIVATNAFGMGIDKPDVRAVVNYDIPDSPEAYFQEAGRAGRDGKKAYAILLYNESALTALKKRIDRGFPEKAYIRNIYHLLGNYFSLEEGDGEGFAFEFDPDDFVRTFKLEHAPALAAIHILQVAGYIECTTDVHARSRVSFLVLRDQLSKINLGTPFLDRLVEFILRNFSGVFVQYAYLDEQVVADRLGTTREEVYESLLGLAKRRIISYVPGNDRPYIVYHQPRVPASYLHIGKEAYEDRKRSYAEKVESMVGYIESKDTCRQLYLMKYFGQKEKQDCGICDVCLSKRQHTSRAEKKKLENEILEQLRDADCEVKELVNSMKEDREVVIRQIRLLLEEDRIYYKTPTILSLK